MGRLMVMVMVMVIEMGLGRETGLFSYLVGAPGGGIWVYLLGGLEKDVGKQNWEKENVRQRESVALIESPWGECAVLMGSAVVEWEANKEFIGLH